jgi:uroporphyrinogen III methyltransferase / synthase
VASGTVYLVGAGPGDPGLITVRGRECLESADYVLYDGLTNASLLDYATRAVCESVGKHGSTERSPAEPIWTQQQINARIVELAQAGHTVVRLKGGDPAVFARTAEELEVLIAEKIPFEVVPGITAALAAASYVGIPITHRRHASAVALITGQQQSEEAPQPIDWDALARFPGTIVFYMGVTTVAQWSRELLLAGKSAETPAAIVRRCTWSDQSVIRCRLDEVADALTPASKMRPPVIVIIGEVAALGKDFDWFSSRPLAGLGVLVTRSAEQSDDLLTLLRHMGAEAYLQPVLEVKPPADRASLEAALQRLSNGEFQGVTFSSANGVDGLLSNLYEFGSDSRALYRTTIGVVGKHTAERLKRYGLRADVCPELFSAAGLLAALPDRLDHQHWLVTKTNRSSRELPDGLIARGAHVTEVIAYETSPVTKLKPGIESALRGGRIHWVTITSAAIAESAAELLAPYRHQLLPVSLSDAVTAKLDKLNWPAAAQATEHSSEQLIQAILATLMNALD